ncbi:hypothetical protein V6Z12_D08G090200 [Gossypium hirsutum]
MTTLSSSLLANCPRLKKNKERKTWFSNNIQPLINT